VLGSDQALVLEHPQRVAYGHPRYAVVRHQLRLRGELIAPRKSAPPDRIPQVVCYLFVNGTITALTVPRCRIQPFLRSSMNGGQ